MGGGKKEAGCDENGMVMGFKGGYSRSSEQRMEPGQPAREDWTGRALSLVCESINQSITPISSALSLGSP